MAGMVRAVKPGSASPAPFGPPHPTCDADRSRAGGASSLVRRAGGDELCCWRAARRCALTLARAASTAAEALCGQRRLSVSRNVYGRWGGQAEPHRRTLRRWRPVRRLGQAKGTQRRDEKARAARMKAVAIHPFAARTVGAANAALLPQLELQMRLAHLGTEACAFRLVTRGEGVSAAATARQGGGRPRGVHTLTLLSFNARPRRCTSFSSVCRKKARDTRVGNTPAQLESGARGRRSVMNRHPSAGQGGDDEAARERKRASSHRNAMRGGRSRVEAAEQRWFL